VESAKEIRNIVRTFDSNEIAILLNQVEEELANRVDTQLNFKQDNSPTNKEKQLRDLQETLKQHSAKKDAISKNDPLTADKSLSPDKLETFLNEITLGAEKHKIPRMKLSPNLEKR